jgi:hypothetical protein
MQPNTYFQAGIEKVISVGRIVKSDKTLRKIDGRVEAKLIEWASGPVPEGHSRWTIRLLEEKAIVELEISVSKDTIEIASKKRIATS